MDASGLEYLVLHVAVSDCQKQIHTKSVKYVLIGTWQLFLKGGILELQRQEVKMWCRGGVCSALKHRGFLSKFWIPSPPRPAANLPHTNCSKHTESLPGKGNRLHSHDSSGQCETYPGLPTTQTAYFPFWRWNQNSLKNWPRVTQRLLPKAQRWRALHLQ